MRLGLDKNVMENVLSAGVSEVFSKVENITRPAQIQVNKLQRDDHVFQDPLSVPQLTVDRRVGWVITTERRGAALLRLSNNIEILSRILMKPIRHRF